MSKTLHNNNHAADNGGRHEFTISPITVLDPTNRVALLPLWIRLPKPGRYGPDNQPATLSMWELVQRSNGKIRTVSLRRAGATKGTRLIDCNRSSIISTG